MYVMCVYLYACLYACMCENSKNTRESKDKMLKTAQECHTLHTYMCSYIRTHTQHTYIHTQNSRKSTKNNDQAQKKLHKLMCCTFMHEYIHYIHIYTHAHTQELHGNIHDIYTYPHTYTQGSKKIPEGARKSAKKAEQTRRSKFKRQTCP